MGRPSMGVIKKLGDLKKNFVIFNFNLVFKLVKQKKVRMAKTRNGGASVTAGAAGVRKQSKENVLGGHKVAKIKATKASGPKKAIGPANKNKAVLAASVDNLTKKTGGLQLKSTGGSAAKDGVPKKVSKAAAPAKKSSGRAKAATLPKGEDPTTQWRSWFRPTFCPRACLTSTV